MKNATAGIAKGAFRLLTAAALLGGLLSGADAFDRDVMLYKGDKLSLGWWGRAQLLGVGQYVPDPVAQHDRVFLFLKQSRLGVNGAYSDLFKYQAELAWGGEDANGSNTDLSLMDFVADVPIKPFGEGWIFKVGQFRVPYSREGLGDEGYQNWSDRSIANLAAFQGRDYGIAVMATQGNLTGTIGTFSGGGRDVPQRYLPEVLGVPEVVGRFGYNDGVDEDIYHVAGTDRDLKRDTKAFFINGLFMQDTRLGHSTAMLYRSQDVNLLVDKNFNPYINRGDLNLKSPSASATCSAITCERGRIGFVGADAVYRHFISETERLEGEIEGNYGGYWNRFGILHIGAARAQGDYHAGKWSFGARYGLLAMDRNAGFISDASGAKPANKTNGTLITGTNAPGFTNTYYYNAHMGQPIHEIAPSIVYHFRDHSMKVVADLPIYLNCPLWIDQVDGAYAFPDPTSVDLDTVLNNTVGGVNSGNTQRRTVVSARMLFQFQF